MKILRRFLVFLLVLIFAFVAFYFWSTGSYYSNKTILFHNQIDTQASQDSTILIMTYNVGYLSGMTNNQATRPDETLYTNNLHKLEKHLCDTLPDIICFQEIDYGSHRSYQVNQHDSLATLFYPCSLRAINWDKKYVPFPYWPPGVQFGRILSGQSVMCKWKLESPKREVLEKVKDNPFYYNAYYLDRLLVSTTVKHPTHDFLLMNVHTEAFDTLARNEQLAFVYQRFKEESAGQALIMAGDFNATLESGEPGIRLFLKDSTIGCVAFHPDQPNYYTFSSGTPEERIDYIFYTKKDFKEVNGRVMSEFGEISDHLPVMATLKFRKLNRSPKYLSSE